VGINPVWVVVGGFNGSRVQDLAVPNINANNISVLLGNGDGTFPAGRTFAVGSLPTSVTVGDFNGDGKLDLAAANWNSGDVSVLLGNGDGTFQPARTFQSGTNPISPAVGDFNRDGKLDLAVAYYRNPSVADLANVVLLRGNGDGTFQPALPFTVGTNPESVVVGDFNRDGKLDLAVANFHSNSVSVLINTSG